MADKKITELDAAAEVTDDDLLVIVNDPGGTPVTKKVTVANAKSGLAGSVSITYVIDGGGSAISTGLKGFLEIPFACTLNAWTLAADVAGAIKIDVWKDTYANFPPTDGDSMCGGHEPEIGATNQKAQNLNLANWAGVVVNAGDVLGFNVDTISTITRVTLSLKATRN